MRGLFFNSKMSGKKYDKVTRFHISMQLQHGMIAKKCKKWKLLFCWPQMLLIFFWEKKLIQITKGSYRTIICFAPFFIFKSLWNLSATRDLIWIFLPLCRKKLFYFKNLRQIASRLMIIWEKGMIEFCGIWIIFEKD